MARSKEEILNKHLNKLEPEYVLYIPQRYKDMRQYTIEAMEEYASEVLREELIKFCDHFYNKGIKMMPSNDEIDEYLKTK